MVITHNDMQKAKKCNRNTTNDLDTQFNAQSPGVITLRCFVRIVTRLRVE